MKKSNFFLEESITNPSQLNVQFYLKRHHLSTILQELPFLGVFTYGPNWNDTSELRLNIHSWLRGTKFHHLARSNFPKIHNRKTTLKWNWLIMLQALLINFISFGSSCLKMRIRWSAISLRFGNISSSHYNRWQF